MKRTNSLSILWMLLLIFSGFSLTAQKDFEGVIKYDIEYLEVPEEVKGMEWMLSSYTIISISDPYFKLENEMMGGEVATVFNASKNEVQMFFDMAGDKIGTTMTSEDIEAMQNEEPVVAPEIEYFDETKKIAGHKCRKALVISDGVKQEVWYTEKFKNYSYDLKKDNISFVPGLVLEYISEQDGIKMKMTCTELLEEKVDASKFQIPEGCYMMTYQEFLEMNSVDEND